MSIVPPETPDSSEVVSDEILHFDYPGSDIILRSCDSHNFRVPKLFIVIFSPVLRELIESVSNNSDASNVEEPLAQLVPVVKLPESKVTLYSLLTFVFPVTPTLPSTTDKIMELLAVAQKYQMDSVLSHIRGIIARQDPPFIRPETALRVYFLAQEHQLHQEAVQAARVTLRLSMTIEGLGDKLEFSGMTGTYLYELWKYRERVRTDLQSGVVEFKNSGLPDDVKSLLCITSRPFSQRAFPRWLGEYIDSIAAFPHLLDLIVFENVRAHHIKKETCRSTTCSCVDISSQVIRAFWEALTAFVHRAIEKVRRTGVTRPHREN